MDKAKLIDALMEELDFEGDGRGPRKAVTFWLKPEDHALFHQYQQQSHRKFGKSIEKLLEKVLRSKKAA